ncbi:MAG: tetratricopeptide repeat protein [Deltaproteobacteria bacterium]|nr:tetratricopeptide repeat protein [Deltaproteobacteria bacterium]
MENNDKRRLSPLKQILFTILIFLLFFACSELALSLFGVQPLILTEDPMVGFGENVPLFVKQKQSDGTFIYRTAKNKLKYFNDQLFPVVKGKNSYRIFCLGGSTTYGRPYDNKLSFCGWLDAYLKETEPGIDWEVINAGGISYASYRVAKLMQELTRYDPDLFIVYSGQNEFLERRSYGKLTDLPPWLIDLESTLNRTRIYSSLKRLYESLRPDSFEKAKKKYELSGEVRTMLEYTAGPASYHRDDNLKKKILTHYHSNLERMILLARQADAQIFFVTPVVNLKDVSPFKSEFKEGLSESSKDLFISLLNKGKKLRAEGNPADALKLYKQAFEIDNRYADLFFEIGRVMFDLKNFEKAEEAFSLAVDEDIAPLRALSYMRSILFDISSKYSVPLVDFEQILKKDYLKEYGHPVFGNETFMDHVHTDDERYRILGLSLIKELKENGIIPAGLALSETQIDKIQKQVRSSLNNEYYRESLLNLARVFDWAGKYEETKNLLMKNLILYGDHGEVYTLLGTTLIKNRETEEAINAFQKAIELGYETPKLYLRLADAYREAGRFSDAFEAYKNKLRLDGAEYEAHMLYGLLYAFQGDNKSAIDSFTESLRLKPDFLPASINMVGSLYIEKRYDEAMDTAKEVLKQDPKQYKMYFVIGQILLSRGDTEGAIQYFTKTLDVAPDFKMAHESLARVRKIKSGEMGN